MDIKRLVEICGGSSTELPHGLIRQQRRDWARKNMERSVVKMNFTAEQKANCFVTLEKAMSKLYDELMAVEVDESLPSVMVGKHSDYHYDNTGNQYKHDSVGELFNYDLEVMELAVNSPSVTVPRGLSRGELMAWLNGDWSEVEVIVLNGGRQVA